MPVRGRTRARRGTTLHARVEGDAYRRRTTSELAVEVSFDAPRATDAAAGRGRTTRAAPKPRRPATPARGGVGRRRRRRRRLRAAAQRGEPRRVSSPPPSPSPRPRQTRNSNKTAPRRRHRPAVSTSPGDSGVAASRDAGDARRVCESEPSRDSSSSPRRRRPRKPPPPPSPSHPTASASPPEGRARAAAGAAAVAASSPRTSAAAAAPASVSRAATAATAARAAAVVSRPVGDAHTTSAKLRAQSRGRGRLRRLGGFGGGHARAGYVSRIRRKCARRPEETLGWNTASRRVVLGFLTDFSRLVLFPGVSRSDRSRLAGKDSSGSFGSRRNDSASASSSSSSPKGSAECASKGNAHANPSPTASGPVAGSRLKDPPSADAVAAQRRARQRRIERVDVSDVSAVPAKRKRAFLLRIELRRFRSRLVLFFSRLAARFCSSRGTRPRPGAPPATPPAARRTKSRRA